MSYLRARRGAQKSWTGLGPRPASPLRRTAATALRPLALITKDVVDNLINPDLAVQLLGYAIIIHYYPLLSIVLLSTIIHHYPLLSIIIHHYPSLSIIHYPLSCHYPWIYRWHLQQILLTGLRRPENPPGDRPT